MHKKDGKVFASLTEVKNKTGDIFNLVDEFGEVILTSYNKSRYKISKITVSDTLLSDSPKKDKAKKAENKASSKTVAAKKEKEPETGLDKNLRINYSDSWNSTNQLEKDFVVNSTKPLQ